VDILPTLLSIAGKDIPDWLEGNILPGLGGNEISERAIYMLEAKSSSAFGRLSRATFSMRRGKYKIIMYRGYKVYGKDVFELYDLENDPEELDDMIETKPLLAEELRNDLIRKFDEIDTSSPN
jgi:arylsulfatase A-like enzyme